MLTNSLFSQPSAQKTILIVEDEFAVVSDLRQILEKAGYKVSGTAFSVAEALEINQLTRPDLVLLDIHLQGLQTGFDLARQLNADQIPFVYISANTNASILEEAKTTQPYGFLVKPFRERDVLVALEIAHYRHAHNMEVRLREEHKLQIALTDALSGNDEWAGKLLKFAQLFQPHIPFDLMAVGVETKLELAAFPPCLYLRVGQEEYQTIDMAGFMQITGITLEQFRQIVQKTINDGLLFYNGDEFTTVCRENPFKNLLAKTFRLHSNLVSPHETEQHGKLLVSFYSRQPYAYQPEHVQLLKKLKPSLVLTFDRLMAYEKIALLSQQLRQENSYLLEEVKANANYEEIVGSSPLLLNIFKSIGQVAPTDYTVLILGETGTGKELIARAVHNRSGRQRKTLIKVNCAALPPQLFESELFGHEKGAFTGASEQRIGKFELAHGGTIFLDEIGELPLELQPKLLRVIQEKEIERIGGKGPIKCDVRIIAATNRHLQQEVDEGRFRADLFYRLNIFPVRLPSLRERKEDLLPLAMHFLQKIGKKLGKPLSGISEASLQQMQAYHWPGNIRELEHLLERAAIMTTTPIISLVELLVAELPTPPAPLVARSHEQAERENVVAALRSTNFRIRGTDGAAALLNLKPTTLEAQMVRLGIRREDYLS